MAHTKDDRYFKLMFIALGILIYLEFTENIDLLNTMGVLADILIWITIAVPTIYFVIKKDVRKLAMVLFIPVIFIIIGLIFTFGSLLNII